jgi:hypothetical protein
MCPFAGPFSLGMRLGARCSILALQAAAKATVLSFHGWPPVNELVIGEREAVLGGVQLERGQVWRGGGAAWEGGVDAMASRAASLQRLSREQGDHDSMVVANWGGEHCSHEHMG